MARARIAGLGLVIALALLVLPSLALGDAKISRSGNDVTIVSDADGDHITNAGTDLARLISYTVRRGEVLRAGPGCVQLRGPRVTAIVVTCGPPSQTQVNAVTLRVSLGGGDDFFQPAGLNDRQPRIVADGGAGNDTIYGGRGNNTILGGDGNDYLQGGGVRSSIDGGVGDDTIKATSGSVSAVNGGDGNDTITAIIARGKATVSCGPGIDTVIESAYAGNRKLVKIAGDCENRKRG
jgi:Ca2+-binding RTX toxin-like protein